MTLSIRHTASTSFAKLVVACLLMLVVLPFTAPFATCDLAAPALCTDMGGDGEAGKVSADAALAVFSIVAVAPLMASTGCVDASTVARFSTHSASFFPLRV